MVIDPLEAIIDWLTTALTSVSGRVAAKHRYGEGWTEGQTGMSVHMDGGQPELYVSVAPMRLEFRIYAGDQVDVVTVWRALVALSRTTERFTVAISGGKTALVHYLKPESQLSLLYEETLRMDMGVVFFEALVSEAAVS